MEFVDPPLTVLVVEDNPNDARLIKRHLLEARSAFLPTEVEVYHEDTLAAGVERATELALDVLLLDLGLPESDGAETFERANECLPEVPVVVLTNLDDEQTAVDLLKRGAQDYLSKGQLSEAELVKSVRYALERQAQMRTLRETTEQLEVLNRILRHDVRNDVQVIQGWGEKVLEDTPHEHSPDLRRVIETSEHIRELTDITGDFLQVLTGGGGLETEPVRVDDLLRDELRKARTAYGDAGFDVYGEFPPATVQANQLLSSVFRNLLSNAVQHNDGDPRVSVGMTAAEDTDAVRVTVADNGPGVPDDRKSTIFGKGDHGLDSEGTGIGLYLVNTLVREFDGSVHVEDRADGTSGAAFVVELPAATPANSHA